MGMNGKRVNGKFVVVLSWLALAAAPVQAEVAVVQQRDGSTARITDLGNGIGMTSDPHGNSEIRPLPSYKGMPQSGPHGMQDQQRVTPFGSPTPPSQLTPPPVLPFNPNRPLLPAPPSPPSATTGSSPGRFGR